MYKGDRASRQEVLDAFEQFHPIGPTIGLKHVWIRTSDPYVPPGHPRVGVYMAVDMEGRKKDECVFDGGRKGSNWKVIDYWKSRSKGKKPLILDGEEGRRKQGRSLKEVLMEDVNVNEALANRVGHSGCVRYETALREAMEIGRLEINGV